MKVYRAAILIFILFSLKICMIFSGDESYSAEYGIESFRALFSKKYLPY